MKIIKLLKDSNILRLGTTKKIEKKTKEENGGFLDISFETLGASLLGNMLAYKSIIWYGNKRVKQGRGALWAVYGSKMDF